MARPWYFLTLIPLGVLLAIASVPAVREQPCLTMAGNAAEFDRIVASSGGVDSTQHGFYFDFFFIAVFMVLVTGVLLADHRWWWAPVAAGVLDASENALALFLLHASAPDFWFKALWVVAAVKLAAYVLSIAEVFCGLRTACQRKAGRDRSSRTILS